MAKNNPGSTSNKKSGSNKNSSKTKKSYSVCSLKSLLLLPVAIAGLAIGWKIVTETPYTKIIQTNSGPIRGEEVTFEEFRYKAFKGIPYAAPPVGELKFKDPAPPQKWTEVRDTRAYGRVCHQPQRMAAMLQMDFVTQLRMFVRNAPSIIRNIIRMRTTTEDCLTLNVFTPSLGEDGLKPVLFWIHGGGFFAGDGTEGIYGPQYLVQQDIVVVTINYRIGPLGFLSTGTADASGNYGMKDQVAALRWVQENIAKFGGDPKQVTIYGESAGGASVHLHLFSPLSKGLFHKAIPASGSALNNWALFSNQDRFNKNLARLLGATESEIKDPAKRVQFLRTANSKKMSDIMFDVVEGEDAKHPFLNPLPFAPVLEPPGTKGAFLTEHPKTLMKQGKFTKVPLMIGSTDLEGAIIYMGIGKNTTVDDVDEQIKRVEKDFCLIAPDALRAGISGKGDCSTVSQQIRDVYFGGKSFDSSILEFLHLMGDISMVSDIQLAQREHAKHATKDAPLYNYIFTFDGEWNILKKMFVPGKIPGAAHGDELPYVFSPTLLPTTSLPPSSREVTTRNRMISFITNFVKFGNPTPTVSDLVPVKWEQAQQKESNTMVIGNELKLKKDIFSPRMDMWNQLYKKYTGSPLFH